MTLKAISWQWCNAVHWNFSPSHGASLVYDTNLRLSPLPFVLLLFWPRLRDFVLSASYSRQLLCCYCCSEFVLCVYCCACCSGYGSACRRVPFHLLFSNFFAATQAAVRLLPLTFSFLVRIHTFCYDTTNSLQAIEA